MLIVNVFRTGSGFGSPLMGCYDIFSQLFELYAAFCMPGGVIKYNICIFDMLRGCYRWEESVGRFFYASNKMH